MEIKNMLGYKLGVCTRRMKRKMDMQLAEYDLTTSQWAVVKLLQEKGELTQKQIADELLGDKATAGEVIRRLEKRDYITKRCSDTDKRAYLVNLTQKAGDVIPKIEQKAISQTKEALADTSQDEEELFYKVLDTIIKNLEE